jgi:hypothetical protein
MRLESRLVSLSSKTLQGISKLNLKDKNQKTIATRKVHTQDDNWAKIKKSSSSKLCILTKGYELESFQDRVMSSSYLK